MNAKKRKRKIPRKPGDVVKIGLGHRKFAFGRVLKSTIAFYDLRTSTEIAVEEIIAKPILFNIWVMDHAITNGDWPIVGNAPLDKELMVEPLFFKKDEISKALTLYRDSTGEEVPATRKDCEGLECAAVWEPEHVVERLNDHFGGRSNYWVESMRP